MEVYNKNRDKNNSLSDEIKEQNAKLKGAPLKDKLLYFKEYYMLTAFAVIIICAVAFSLVYTMVTAPDDTALGIFFYNDTGDSSSTRLIDGFAKYRGIDTAKHKVYIDSTMSYSPDFPDMDTYVSLEKAMAAVTSSDLDIIVGDTAVIDYFAKCGLFGDVTLLLPDDLLEKYKDRLYYAACGESAEQLPVGIRIFDSPALNEYNYYTDKEPVFAFVVNSDNIDNAVEFLKYIYIAKIE